MKFVLEGHAYSPKMIIFSFIGIICVYLTDSFFNHRIYEILPMTRELKWNVFD